MEDLKSLSLDLFENANDKGQQNLFESIKKHILQIESLSFSGNSLVFSIEGK